MACRGTPARHRPPFPQQRRGTRLTDAPTRTDAGHRGSWAAEVLLAFDFGRRRIGVAVGQTTTGSASAAGAVPCHDGAPDWSAVDTCIAQWAPTRLLVGLPYNMDGTDTTTTAGCRDFGAMLAQRSGLPVEFVDERLTSAAAYDELRNERRSGARARRIRPEDIDANAARLILESWLNANRQE